MALFPPLPFVTLSYKLYIYILYTHPIRFIIIAFCLCLLKHKLEEKLQTNIYFCSVLSIQLPFPGLFISSCGYKLLSMSFHFYMKDSLKYFLQDRFASDTPPSFYLRMSYFLLLKNMRYKPQKITISKSIIQRFQYIH